MRTMRRSGESVDQEKQKMKRRRIHTKDAYGRGKFSVSEVFAAFKDFPKVKEKEGAIKDLKLQWEFKLQLRFKSENSLYEALTHYKLANAFNREVNLRESEIWRRNDELRWFGQMMVDACMLRNLQRIFRRASGRLLEEEKNRVLEDRKHEFGLLKAAEKRNVRAVMLVESDIDIDGDSTVSCALAIIGAAFVDGSYELAEKMVNKWLFKDLFEHYEENKELLFSAPLSEELQGPNPKAQLNSFFTKFPGQYKPNYLLKIASTNSAGLKRTQFVFSLGIEDYHVPTKRIDNLAPGMGISQRAAHEDAARNFIKILEHDERNIVKRLTYIKSTEEERLEHQQIKIESGMKIKKEEATSKNKTKDDDQESDDDDTVAEQSPSYQPASPPYEELAHLWEYDYEDKYRIKLQNDNCILKNINELCRRYLSVEKLDWEEWDNGEPHQRSFTAKLTILGKVYAIAKGNSKKGAKKKAALEAYPKLFHQRTDNSDH